MTPAADGGVAAIRPGNGFAEIDVGLQSAFTDDIGDRRKPDMGVSCRH